MENANFIIFEDKIEIHNVSKLKEYNTLIVEVEIKDIPYIITGENLNLVNTADQNTTLYLEGTFHSIRSKGYKQKSESFLQRLFR